jgi:putative ABC transport system permease protein
MALGAQRGDVLGLALRETMRPAGIGLTLGFAGPTAASRLMSSLLFGLSALNPAAFLGGLGVLGGGSHARGLRAYAAATRVDPRIALRCE